MQVRLCRAKTTGEVFAMKKLKKSDMLSRGQVQSLNRIHFSYLTLKSKEHIVLLE